MCIDGSNKRTTTSKLNHHMAWHITLKNIHITALRCMRPRSFGRFALMGGVNTLVGVGSFPALYWFLDRTFSVNVLLILSWIVSTAFAFISHKLITFESGGAYHWEGIKFFVLSLATLGINLLIMNIALSFTSFNPVVIQLVVSFVVAATMMILNYLGMNHFIFKSTDKK